MMRPIHSLEDLRAAKRELAVRREVTKQEFRKQLHVVQRDAGSYLLKKVLLPLGLGVGAFFAYKYFFGKEKEKEEEQEKKETIEDLKSEEKKPSWVSYLSLVFSVLRLVQQMRANKEETASDEDSPVQDETEPVEEPAFTPKDFVAGYRRQAAASQE